MEREVPLASLVGWGATNLGIDLNFGRTRPPPFLLLLHVAAGDGHEADDGGWCVSCVAGVPGLFFATRRASEVSDVLLRTLSLMRDERERETASASTAAAADEKEERGVPCRERPS